MDRDSTTDEELLRLFVAGDDDAFGVLMRKHEDRIFALCFRMTGNRSDALDATQDAFIAALRQAATFRGDSSFGTWLYRVAINACHDLLRKRGRQAAVVADPDDASPETAVEPAVEENVSLRLDIAAALAQLQADYREAVVMHDLGGIPYEEIARATNANLGTVKSRISRGRRRLAELLEQPGAPPASNEEK